MARPRPEPSVGLDASMFTHSKGRASLGNAALRDADAGVFDVEIDGVADATGADGDPAAFGRVFDSVRQKLAQDLADGATIRVDHRLGQDVGGEHQAARASRD